MKKFLDFLVYCLAYLILLILSPVIITIVFLIFMTPKRLDSLAIYLLRIIIYFIAYLIFRVGNKIEIIGRENVPREGRVLFLSNHQTLIDSFLIALGTMRLRDVLFHQRRLAFNVPETNNFYFNGFLRILFKALKTVPVSRGSSNRRKIENQVSQFSRLLRNDSLVIFFEGTRTRNGSINECRVGPALTIIKAKPDQVIPIFLEGIQPIMPIKYGSKINLHINMGGHRGRMIIGPPLDVSEFSLPEYNWDDAISQSVKLRKFIKQAVENLKPSE